MFTLYLLCFVSCILKVWSGGCGGWLLWLLADISNTWKWEENLSIGVQAPACTAPPTPSIRPVLPPPAIVAGLATYGWKIMRVLGVKMTRLTNTRGKCGVWRHMQAARSVRHAALGVRGPVCVLCLAMLPCNKPSILPATACCSLPPPHAGYCVELAAAVVIIVGSRYGLPLSTTHWWVATASPWWLLLAAILIAASPEQNGLREVCRCCWVDRWGRV